MSLPKTASPVIWGVSAYHLTELFEICAPDFYGRGRIEVIRTHFGEALAEIKQRLRTERCDAIVTAGANATYLSAQLDVPVITVRVGSFDLISALAKARQLTNRIAVVLYKGFPANLQQFIQTFHLGIELRSYDTENDARNVVYELKSANYDVVIGAGLVVDIAMQVNMRAIFLYSRESVFQALDDAFRLAETQRLERARHHMLSTVLYHLRDGVIAVDNNGQIIATNPSAEKLTRFNFGEAIGVNLNSLAPEFNLEAVISGGMAETGIVQQINGHTVIVDTVPLRDANSTAGAIITLHLPEAVEAASGKLRAFRQKRSHVARYSLAHIVQESAQMKTIARRAAVVAEHSDATVLISGPSGVGKELLAQGIHNASRRAKNPFLAINCGALPESLLESEMFGYEEGAFTGAKRTGKVGFFEAAHRGTVFLDEIGEMPLLLQSRLLRVLQEREVTRIGGVTAIPVDIRIIAATHRDLAAMIQQGKFREDLYYRISVLRIVVPPLKERPEDIQALTGILLRAALANVHLHQLADGILDTLPHALQDYEWPGNVRELENLAERIAIACLELGRAVKVSEIRELLDENLANLQSNQVHTLSVVLALREKEHIMAVLSSADGDQDKAARVLGLSRTTLWRKIKHLGINDDVAIRR